jgi:hypothetical protein
MSTIISRSMSISVTRGSAVIMLACAAAFAQAQQSMPIPTGSQASPPPANIVMTKEYVATVGRMAYLWGWPLINARHRQRVVQQGS